MHYVTESATTTRELRRQATEQRIQLCAQRLTEAHGLEGFTMDDLATEAGVSRRTLFNYFPSKLDAVLGVMPCLPPEALATFRAGGPSGRLADDLGELALALLGLWEADREDVARGHRLFTSTPRLIVAVHERFAGVTEEFVAMVLDREGTGFGAARAGLAVRLLRTVFDSALATYVEGSTDQSLVDLFREHLQAARDLLA
jgi:AcrR family transcriptional regulator